MPLYEYRCPKCKKLIELMQTIDDRIAPICCEVDCSIEMDRVISKTNFSLTGQCWAKDGYASRKR